MNMFEGCQVDKSLTDIREDIYGRIEKHQANNRFPTKLVLDRGFARGMVELVCWASFQIHKLLMMILKQGFPITSSGIFLKAHCEGVEVFQKGKKRTRGKVTLIKESTSSYIPIPDGFTVKTKPDDKGRVFQYVSIETKVVFPKDDTTLEVEVEAMEAGAAYNVPKDYITEFGSTLPGVTAVTNSKDWITEKGLDLESEKSLKNRYQLAWKGINGLNKHFYEGLALSVQGVKEVYVNDQHPEGQATIDVICRGEKGAPGQEVISTVQALLDKEKPLLDKPVAKAVEQIEVVIEATLTLTNGNPETILAEAERRLWLLNKFDMTEEEKEREKLSPLDISDDLTQDILVSAAMVPNVKKITWSSPENDLVATNKLIVIKSINLKHTWQT